jgi:hypothetical protein
VDAYLIPLAADRYELYCEPASDTDNASSEPRAGWFERWIERFRMMVARLDVPEPTASVEREAPALRDRVRARVVRWAAEKVAEQRLLWRLRKTLEARVFHPDNVPGSEAGLLVRHLLTRDFERHRRWMVIDVAALAFVSVVLGPFFLLIPGVANLPAVYFGFRALGHYLSMRGARQGLKRVAWTPVACDALTPLRGLRDRPRAERLRVVDELAARLGLVHFPRFFRRTAGWRA